MSASRSLGLLLALAWLSLGLTPALAEDLKLSSARIGYRGAEAGKAVLLHGGVEGQDAWLPCELVLSNTGSSTYGGSLVIEEQASRGASYRWPLTLGPRAKKRIRLNLIYRPGSALRVRFLDQERGSIELAAVDVQGRAQRPGLSLPEARSLSEPLVLVLRGSDSFATPLTRLQGDFTADDTLTREWRTIELEGTSALPDEATALHRVAVLILGDLDLPSLSEAQQEAILAWVAAGGRLWVSSLKADTTGPLGAALPGRRGQVVSERRLVELEPSLGTIHSLPGAKELRTFAPRPGDLAWRGGERTAVLHRRHGRGWIIRAGFRLTRASFDLRPLIRELLALNQESRSARLPSRRLLDELKTALAGSTLKRMPPRIAVVGLVVLYALFGVALPFAVFRRGGRLELAWACVLLSTALTTGVVVWLGKTSQQHTRSVRVSLVEGGSAGPNVQVSALALFSRDGGPLALRFQSPLEGAAVPPLRRGGRSPRSGYSEGAQGFVLETNPQDTSLLATRQRVDLPGWVRYTQTGPRSARVERSEGWEIQGAWAFDGTGVRLKTLAAPSELAAGPWHLDPVLEPALRSVLAMASARARVAERPLLVFRWKGPDCLEGTPDFGLDVGLVWAEAGWGAWGASPREVVRFGPGSLDSKGTARFSFYAALADPSRSPVLTVNSARRPFQVLDRRVGAWVTPEGYAAVTLRAIHRSRWRRARPRGTGLQPPPAEVPDTLRATPLGVARGEILFPEGEDLSDPSFEVILRVSGTRAPRTQPGSHR